MTRTLLALGLALITAPLAAQDAPGGAPASLPALSMQQQTGLKCGVLFGLVAKAQADGDPAAAAYPAMNPRGREFFVRTMASLMDDKGWTREDVSALAIESAEQLMEQGPQARDQMMPACLLLLDASGL